MNWKNKLGLVLVLLVVTFLFILLYDTLPHNTSIHLNNSQSLDPILNISSSENLVTGLNITQFVNVSSLTFTPTNQTQTESVYINIPKYALVNPSTYNMTSLKFTGNIAYTPQATTTFPTANCATNHSAFTGNVFVNGVNTSVSDQNFIGGLFSASGSGSASVSISNSCASPGTPYPSSTEQSSSFTFYANPTCSASLSPNPDTTCDTNPSASVSESCPSGYSGGSCSSASISYGTALNGGTTLSTSPPSSCNAPSTTQCANTNQCEVQSLSYLVVQGTNGLQTSGACAVSNEGTTSYATSCGTFSLPSLTPTCVSYETSTYGTHTSGYTFTCNNQPLAQYGDGCLNLGLSFGNGQQCTTSGGCVITSSANSEASGYYASSTITQPASNLGYGDSYTVPSPSQTLYTCVSGSVTIPDGDYYTVNSMFNGCPTPQKLFYNDRVDYPYYDYIKYYIGVASSTSIAEGASFPSPANAGSCYTQNTLTSVATGASSSVTGQCSQTTTSYSCSPSSVTYNCANDYNSSTPNYCLSSTPGKIVYSASIPSPGSGSITGVTAIPNSCFNTYTDTAVSNITQKVAGTLVYSNSTEFVGTEKINFTSELKPFLSSCTVTGSNCTLQISTSSSTPGLIKFNGLNIPYSYNVSALYSKSYNAFNDSNYGIPIKPNSTLLWGATLTAEHSPFKTIAVRGIDSKSNCQIQIGSSFYTSKVNSSNICPLQFNLTTSGQWKSFNNGSVSSIITYNKQVKPIIQTIQTPSQDTALVSTPGVSQYILVPETIKSNASDYGVTTSLNISILKPSINDFSFDNPVSTFLIPNGTTNENIVYSGNAVKSVETYTSNAAQWKTNTITIEDIWNNTSPYSFTNLTKTYLFSKGSKFINCYINSTSIKGTNECVVTNNSNGSISVKITYTKALPPGKVLDPTIVLEAPNVTESQTSYIQALSSQLTCTTSYLKPSCSNSTLIPSLSATATFNNTGSFLYNKINLSAVIPNTTLSGDIIIEAPNGSSISPYYYNISKGIVNWTTSNFIGNSVENWTITVKTEPLQTAFTSLSSGNEFEQEITYTVPPSSPILSYTSISLKETSPFLTEYSFSLSPSFNPSVTSVGSLSTSVSVSSSRSDSYFVNSLSSLTGSLPIYTKGQIGNPPSCSIVYQNQTAVSVGQNAQYYYLVDCYNNNSIVLDNYVDQFPLPSTAFDIHYAPAYKNKSLISPLTPVPLSYTPGTFIPLVASYNARASQYFVIEFEIQPLAFSYNVLYPSSVYAGIPAPVTVNTSLQDSGSIEVDNVSYSIPVTVGSNASFIINGTQISSSKTINGTYKIEFPRISAHSIEYGTLYYYIPTLTVTKEDSFSLYSNNTQYTYTPLYVSSISPIPLNTTYLLMNATLDNQSSCQFIQSIYSSSSASSLSGTSLKFTCEDNNNEVLVNMGSFDLSQSKFITVKSNPVLKALIISSPTPSIFQPVINFFVSIGNAIYNGLKAIGGFLTHL